jgi:hypothetical protein
MRANRKKASDINQTQQKHQRKLTRLETLEESAIENLQKTVERHEKAKNKLHGTQPMAKYLSPRGKKYTGPEYNTIADTHSLTQTLYGQGLRLSQVSLHHSTDLDKSRVSMKQPLIRSLNTSEI